MTINSKMNEEAANWAKRMADLGTLRHSSNEERNGDGENIYYSCGMAATGGTVTTSW